MSTLNRLERRKVHYEPSMDDGFIFMPEIGNWRPPYDQRKEPKVESITIKLDGDAFDAAVHGPPEGQPSLPEGGDLAIYVKKDATVLGNTMAVITFTVQVPGGGLRRAQCPTTVANLINVLAILKGWQEGGHLK